LYKIFKAQIDKGFPVVCMLCMQNDTVSLKHCVILCTISKVNNRKNISNFSSHLERLHKNDHRLKEIKTKEDRLVEAATKNGVDSLTNNKSDTGDIKKLLNTQEVGVVVKEFESNLYKCIVSMGAAARQIENKELRELLKFTADMGSILNNKSHHHINVSRKKFNQLKFQSFCHTVMNTQCFVEYCRQYYRETTQNESTPFINVLHDIWSKDLSEVLGVSITFIDPTSFIYYRYAIGIQTVINHKSAYIVDKINGILSRMNIESGDIWRAINDNANAA
jgi:hypothetical protein